MYRKAGISRGLAIFKIRSRSSMAFSVRSDGSGLLLFGLSFDYWDKRRADGQGRVLHRCQLPQSNQDGGSGPACKCKHSNTAEPVSPALRGAAPERLASFPVAQAARRAPAETLVTPEDSFRSLWSHRFDCRPRPFPVHVWRHHPRVPARLQAQPFSCCGRDASVARGSSRAPAFFAAQCVGDSHQVVPA